MKRRWLWLLLGLGLLVWLIGSHKRAQLAQQSPPPLVQARTNYNPARIWG